MRPLLSGNSTRSSSPVKAHRPKGNHTVWSCSPCQPYAAWTANAVGRPVGLASRILSRPRAGTAAGERQDDSEGHRVRRLRKYQPQRRAASLILVGSVLAILTVVSLDSELGGGVAITQSATGVLVSVTSLLLGGLAFREATQQSRIMRRQSGLVHAQEDFASIIERELTDAVDSYARPFPLRVRWSSIANHIAATPSEVLGEGVVGGRPRRLKLKGDTTSLPATFQMLPAKRLAVLGPPGAGKTVLVQWLARSLLRERAEGDPVPVVVSFASWNPNKPAIQWLVERLSEQYPALADERIYGTTVFAELVENGGIVPILDGLDEVATDQRGTAIITMNQAFGDRPLIVTSRTDAFEAAVRTAGVPLSRAALVALRPAEVDDVAMYLAAGQVDGRQRWSSVIANLRAGIEPLCSTLSTPLMIYLARIAFLDPNSIPDELCAFSNRSELEAYLIDGYLPAIYRRPTSLIRSGSGPAKSWRATDAERYLMFLAMHMTEVGTRDFVWWRLSHAIRWWRLVFGAAVGLVFLLVYTTTFSIFVWATPTPSQDSPDQPALMDLENLLVILAVACVQATILALVYGLTTETTGLSSRWLRTRPRRPVLAAVVVVGAALAVLCWFQPAWWSYILVIAVTNAFLPVAGGAFAAIFGAVVIRERFGPNKWRIRRSLVRWTVAGMVVAPLASQSIAVEISLGSTFGLTFGLLFSEAAAPHDRPRAARIRISRIAPTVLRWSILGAALGSCSWIPGLAGSIILFAIRSDRSIASGEFWMQIWSESFDALIGGFAVGAVIGALVGIGAGIVASTAVPTSDAEIVEPHGVLRGERHAVVVTMFAASLPGLALSAYYASNLDSREARPALTRG